MKNVVAPAFSARAATESGTPAFNCWAFPFLRPIDRRSGSHAAPEETPISGPLPGKCFGEQGASGEWSL